MGKAVALLLTGLAAAATYLVVTKTDLRHQIHKLVHHHHHAGHHHGHHGGPEFSREFDEFIHRFHKHYESGAEKAQRFEIFKANSAFVAAENAKGTNTYRLEVNVFADMSVEEFSSTHMGHKTEKPRKVWGALKHLGTHKYSGAALPTSVDWRAKGAVTPVKNQGQCGACWAFSTTGALEGAWQLASSTLVSLSEQQLVDCSHNGDQGCNGGLMDNGFTFEEGVAPCTEASYPYTAKTGTTCKKCTAGIPAHDVTGFKDVTVDDTNALMEAVAQQPVSIAIEADKSAFQLYAGGVLNSTCGTQLDHGVLVVGYGTDTTSGSKAQDYWIVKNSWGATWGEAGYIRLLRGKSGPGECGLKSDASYPIVKKQEPLQQIQV